MINTLQQNARGENRRERTPLRSTAPDAFLRYWNETVFRRIIFAMNYGVDYYPEHWDPERWPIDLDLMAKARFDTVRVAEFAWSRLEPSEGRYDFDWLDHFIDLSRGRGISVMLGVPARNVPAWLIAADPGVAIVNADGQRESFGTRYTTCINNQTLRDRAFALAGRMAERYAGNTSVTSWHLDNELGDASLCYCPTCRSRFIEWLAERYGMPARVNEAWGLAFWSLEINDWNEVFLPARTNHFPHNPGLLLDFRRFSSDNTVDFARRQAEVIRTASPAAIITTNFQSMTRFHTDYFALAGTVDVVSTNYYPPESYRSVDLDMVRSLLGKGFWVVEQKSAAPDAKVRLPSHTRVSSGALVPEPGETRAYAYQSVARGAEMVLYFRWRPALFGAEKFHGGIVRYDGRPGRIYDEIRRTGEELSRIGSKIDGTCVSSEAAIIYSYESRWELDAYSPGPEMEYRATLVDWHSELEAEHVSVDIVPPHGNFAAYRLIVAPLLYVMDNSLADALVAYVRGGGTLVLCARSGATDSNAALHPRSLPDPLVEVLGIDITESFPLRQGQKTVLESNDGATWGARAWVDLIDTTNAAGVEVVARYAEGWYRGVAAAVRRSVGRGRIYYLGTVPEDAWRRLFVAELVRETGLKPVLAGSRHIQITRRIRDEAERESAEGGPIFVVNPTARPGLVHLDAQYLELLTGTKLSGNVDVPGWGVMILDRME